VSTLVVYSDTSDNTVASGSGQESPAANGNYAEARSGTNGKYTTAADAQWNIIGQLYQRAWGDDGDPDYNPAQYDFFEVNESFLGFDTSSIPDTDTVSAAVLRVTSFMDASDTDFDIQARLRDWGTTVTTADYVPGASLSGLTLLGSYATSSGFTGTTGYDFSDTAMAANVNKTGSTRMLLCSSRTTGNNAPTTTEYVNIYSADYTGTTRDPKLTVTYAAGGSTLFLMLEDDSGAYELEDDSGGILLEPGA